MGSINESIMHNINLPNPQEKPLSIDTYTYVCVKNEKYCKEIQYLEFKF